eukprot:CAMPEP_0172180580 /NCGR_PEP_ID=MMETSP1050-20130122/17319_1 /TAXON_ID=233186 /ORGANISM="Cryptomonas curvata, Strain CCAP979/52" /LENGTH=280 /DNA_ID=CAMNT_0012853723 /DNA_START=308 /DNA_END=1147 /DNA_ORIENTATION=-
MGTNVSTNFITCPADPQKTLGIKLPFLVMIIKNLKKYFTFEVQVLDDKNVRRRFRASNYQSTTRVKPFICTMPMRLDEGWNQIQFNLSDFTRRAYGTNYIETLRVQIHANCRIRRIYFSDRLYSEDELPPEFKLFLPVQNKWGGTLWPHWGSAVACVTTCYARSRPDISAAMPHPCRVRAKSRRLLRNPASRLVGHRPGRRPQHAPEGIRSVAGGGSPRRQRTHFVGAARPAAPRPCGPAGGDLTQEPPTMASIVIGGPLPRRPAVERGGLRPINLEQGG